MKLLIILMMLVLSSSALAFSSAPFHKRYKLIQDKEGKLIAIKDRYLITQFFIKPFLDKIKNDLKEEQKRLQMTGLVSREEQIDAFVEGLEFDEMSLEGSDVKQIIADSLKNIKELDIDDIFKELEKSQFFKEFESKIQNALLLMSLNVVANLEDPKYFFKKNVAHEIIVTMLNIAKDRFSQLPLLNFASFVVVRVEQFLREQRNFSQNMLMHYFENFEAQDLGMEMAQVDKAMSSIYESRLAWSDFNGSKEAKENWDKYGWTKFYSALRAGNRALGANKDRYTGPIKKIDYAFAQVKEEEDEKFIHVFHTWHSFTTRPAAAFYPNKPYKILSERRLLGLAEVALNFLPLPGWSKNLAETVIGSFYRGQAQTEGALAAYFESKKDYQSARIIYLQNTNPFLFLPQ